MKETNYLRAIAFGLLHLEAQGYRLVSLVDGRILAGNADVDGSQILQQNGWTFNDEYNSWEWDFAQTEVA